MKIIITKEEAKQPLTQEDKAMIEKAKKAPIVYDDDCPELSDEQLTYFKRSSDTTREQLKAEGTERQRKKEESENLTQEKRTIKLPSWMIEKINSLDAEGEAKLGKFLVSL